MLRLLFFLLLLANVLFFAWTQGALDHVIGVRSIGDREPERLAEQFRPEDLTVLSIGASAVPAEQSRTECLEVGPYGNAEIAAVEQAASALAANLAWSRRQVELPGVWAVVMGPYANREALDKKLEELKRARVVFEEITDQPAFKLSLSLGRHESVQAANVALVKLGERGIKTARVAAFKSPSSQWFLRLDNADAAMATQLRTLKGTPWGAGWSACP